MDRYEGKNGPNNKKIHSVEVQANSTESVFELYTQREVKKSDLECQWPCGEAPPCKQILLPSRKEESFLSVDRTVLLFCYRKLPEAVLVACSTILMGL